MSEKQVAREALRAINERSKNEDREYGIWIFRHGGQFRAGEPFTSDLPDGLAEQDLLKALANLPKHAVRTAFAHTHGGNDPGMLSSHFSSDDIKFGEHFSVNLYLATPNDQLVIFKQGNRPGEFQVEKLKQSWSQ